MTIAMPSPIPLIALFVFIAIVALICLVKFSSLRAYGAYATSLGPSIVTYDIDYHGNQLFAGRVNRFTVTCENLGRTETSFYLVLTSQNATLNVDGNQEFVQMNDTAIKVPFALSSPRQQVVKTVSFWINQNTTSAQFHTNIEPMPPSSHRPTSTGSTCQVDCYLNLKTNTFNFTARPGPYA